MTYYFGRTMQEHNQNASDKTRWWECTDPHCGAQTATWKGDLAPQCSSCGLETRPED